MSVNKHHSILGAVKEWDVSIYDILRAAIFSAVQLLEDNPDFGWSVVGNNAQLLLLIESPLNQLESLFTAELIIKDNTFIQRIDRYILFEIAYSPR